MSCLSRRGKKNPNRFLGGISNISGLKNIPLGNFQIFGLSGYRGVNGRLADDLPSTPVALICLEGNEPAVFLQNSGRVVSVLLFPGGAGSVHQDFSRADGWFVPRLEPVEELLCGILVRWFGHRFGWPVVRKSFEQVHMANPGTPGVLLS